MGSFGEWVSSLGTEARGILDAEAKHVSNEDFGKWSKSLLGAYWAKFAGLLVKSDEIKANGRAGIKTGMRVMEIGDFMGEAIDTSNEELSSYFDAMRDITWDEIKGVLMGEHSILMPIHRKGEDIVTKCYIMPRDSDASAVVKATAPDMDGCELLCMLELGRYAVPLEGEDGGPMTHAPAIGGNGVTVDARLGSAFIVFTEEDDGCLVGAPTWNRVDWKLDTNEPGSMQCLGLGPIEEAMFGYAALKVQLKGDMPPATEKPTNTGGIDLGNRGGIDPSLN